MKTRITLSLLLACALILSGLALADSDYDFDASVVCVQPEYVKASIGGSVSAIPVLEGQLVSTGDVLASLATTRVYATADGTVTGVFCETGDSVSAVTDRYGALLYIEPTSKYTLTASTDNAYNAAANKYIHTGEWLYLSCSDGTHTGMGFVTSISGTDFTIEVTSGSFTMGETVSAYRDSDRNSKSRVGRGDIERISNIAVTGSSSNDASVVAMHVRDGDAVKAGDLLLETLSGEFDGYYCTGSDLTSTSSGILAGLNVSVGANVTKGDIIATLYPRENLQLKVSVNEADIAALTEGMPVLITFNWNEDADEDASVTGTVARVLYSTESSGANEGDAANYAVYIDFDADENIRIGMTATVRPVNSAPVQADAAENE